MTIPVILRKGYSYSLSVEKYSDLLRKISIIHPKVLFCFKDEVDLLLNRIDTYLLKWEDNEEKEKSNLLFELRRLLFRLDDIVNVKVLQKYNEFIEGELFLDKTGDIEIREKDISDSSKSIDYDNKSKMLKNKDIKTSTDPKEVWADVMDYLKQKLNVPTYNVWVKPIEFEKCEDSNIIVKVDNQFYKNWLDEHCSKMIHEFIDEKYDNNYKVNFVSN